MFLGVWQAGAVSPTCDPIMNLGWTDLHATINLFLLKRKQEFMMGHAHIADKALGYMSRGEKNDLLTS